MYVRCVFSTHEPIRDVHVAHGRPQNLHGLRLVLLMQTSNHVHVSTGAFIYDVCVTVLRIIIDNSLIFVAWSPGATSLCA